MTRSPLTPYVSASLYLTAPANLLVGYALAFPHTAPARLIDLPVSQVSLYTLLAGSMVMAFGFAYLWLASDPLKSRPLLLLGAAGKTVAATIALVLFGLGELSATTTVLLQGDLLLALFWFVYLWQQRKSASFV